MIVGIKAQVVIIQEEGVVTDLVCQRARPVLAQIAARFAVAIPHRTHVDLSRSVGNDPRGRDRIGEQIGNDAALHGIGSQAIRGVNLHVRRVPVLAIEVDVDLAQCGLPVTPVKQQFRGAVEIVFQLREKLLVLTRVPFQGDVEVEEDQRIRRGHDERLHARC